MHLYLVRHGDALDTSINPDRPLSDTGRREALTLGAYVKALQLQIPQIWHSGKTRAEETATILNDRAALGAEVTERTGLSPTDAVDEIAEQLSGRHRDLCIVGHLPHLSHLASQLTAGDAQVVRWAFEPCTILNLEREGPGEWWVHWFVHPGGMPRKPAKTA